MAIILLVINGLQGVVMVTISLQDADGRERQRRSGDEGEFRGICVFETLRRASVCET